MAFEHYILDGRTVRKVGRDEWLTWLETHDDGDRRRVRETTLPDGRWLSTVFVTHDLRLGVGRPLLFETMLFKSRDDLEESYVRRYTTYEEAEAGHEAVLKRLREGRAPYGDEP